MAKEFNKQEVLDYIKTFLPVAKMVIISSVVVVSTTKG